MDGRGFRTEFYEIVIYRASAADTHSVKQNRRN